MSDHANIHILEFEDILEVMLLISSYIGNESPLSLLDVVSVTCHYFIQLFSQSFGGDFFINKFNLANLGNSNALISEISNKGLLMSFYQ